MENKVGLKGQVMRVLNVSQEFKYVDSEEQGEGLMEIRVRMGNSSCLYTSSLLDFVTTSYYFCK